VSEPSDQPCDDHPTQQRDTALQAANSALVLQRRERKEMHAKLQDLEDKFRQLAEQSSEGFWFVEVNPLRVVYVSPAVEEIFGRPAQSFYQDPHLWMASIHPDDQTRVLKKWEMAVGSQSPRFCEEYRVVRCDGSVRWVLSSGTALEDDEGAVTRMSGIIQDVTERRALEAQLRHAQKMETVGRLAGGVAHDFNNLLTVINGISDLALSALSPGDPLRQDLEEIRRAGESGALLTRQLLAFSRKQVLQPRVLCLNTVVMELTSMLVRLLHDDIDLVFTPGCDNASVCADAGQIEQVIVNLAVNARDAMPHGGTLTLATATVMLDEPFARRHGVVLEPGPYILLTMSDTGSGMDEVTMARMFEPFFTTKGVGQGTGLGLSTAYGIVKQSDGVILASSGVGRGTSFSIYLPHIAQSAGHDRPLPTAASAPGGAETILLVDDNEGIRALASRILEKAGYRVIASSNGPKALSLLERHDGPVHLLLTDVVMPGMNGQALARRVRETRGGIKVLFTSGYIDDAIVHHGVLDEAGFFLDKPFTVAALIRKVRDVLDSSG
jgi:two-component system cell cycle sensor histidine kinase/response regulator CckA